MELAHHHGGALYVYASTVLLYPIALDDMHGGTSLWTLAGAPMPLQLDPCVQCRAAAPLSCTRRHGRVPSNGREAETLFTRDDESATATDHESATATDHESATAA